MRALDLFAGPGGWDVATRKLGYETHGVENDAPTLDTRGLNGLTTIGFDVWPFVETSSYLPGYDLVIASPPCPTFSMTGNGKGRRAISQVLEMLEHGAFRNHVALHEFGQQHDPRTALVVLPMDVIERQMPRFVALEQVPSVLPIWEKYAEMLGRLGYSVATGVLDAVEYGVPQTRRRAVLVARADGLEARLPAPTHSRYHRTDPFRLDEGLLPWVSMREALGWGEGVVGLPRIDDGRDPGVVIDGTVYRLRDLRDTAKPSATITGKARSWRLYTANNKLSHAAWRNEVLPAPTVTGGHDYNNRRIYFDGGDRRVLVEEVAALQTFPKDFTFSGPESRRFLQVGNAVPPLFAEAILSTFRKD